MKNLLLLSIFCLFHLLSFTQESVNKTDSNGLKQGKWVSRYPGGSLKYEGIFNHDKPFGEWKRYHENGKVKALMSYRANSDRVFASLYDEEGALYAKGVFEGNLRDSTWNFFLGDKLVQTENYVNGKKTGKSVGYDHNGKIISEKEWKNDLQEGKSVDFFPGGVVRNKVTWVAGKKNGPALFYDQNGVVTMDGMYLNDLPDSEWNVYDNEGSLKFKIKYSKGEILNSGTLDTLQLKEFKQYDMIRGKIPEPKVNESGMPERP